MPGLVLTEEEVRRILEGAARAHRQASAGAAERGQYLHAWGVRPWPSGNGGRGTVGR